MEESGISAIASSDYPIVILLLGTHQSSSVTPPVHQLQPLLTMVKGKTNTAAPLAKDNDGNPNAKRSREDLSRSDDDVPVSTLDDVLARMEHLFRETNKKIDSCKEDLQTEISTLRSDVQQLKEECRGEIDELTTSINTVRADVSHNAERIAYTERVNDLIVSGVPYNHAENLADICTAISVALGYTQEDIPLVRAKRLARFPMQANAAPPIMVQFAFKCVRDEFYRRYLSSRNLSLTHLGFNVNQRIFMNENLTKDARRLKNYAVKLKQNGKLFGVFTKDGCIYVKTTADAEAVQIRSINELPK